MTLSAESKAVPLRETLSSSERRVPKMGVSSLHLSHVMPFETIEQHRQIKMGVASLEKHLQPRVMTPEELIAFKSKYMIKLGEATRTEVPCSLQARQTTLGQLSEGLVTREATRTENNLRLKEPALVAMDLPPHSRETACVERSQKKFSPRKMLNRFVSFMRRVVGRRS